MIGDELNRKQQAASYTTRAKQPRLGIDANVPSTSCTVTTSPNVCFLMYQEDKEDDDWVQCACSR